MLLPEDLERPGVSGKLGLTDAAPKLELMKVGLYSAKRALETCFTHFSCPCSRLQIGNNGEVSGSAAGGLAQWGGFRPLGRRVPDTRREIDRSALRASKLVGTEQIWLNGRAMMQSQSKQQGDLPVADGKKAAERVPQMQSKPGDGDETSWTCRKGSRATWKGKQGSRAAGQHAFSWTRACPQAAYVCQGKGPLDAVCVHLPARVPGVLAVGGHRPHHWTGWMGPMGQMDGR